MTDVTLRIRGDASGVIRASAEASRAVSGIEGAADQAGTAGRRAGQQIAEGAGQAEQASQRAAQAMRSLVATAAAAFGTAQIIAAADAYTRMTGALTLATSSTREFNAAQATVFDIAQSTRQPLEAVTGLYARLSSSLRETGASQEDLATITRTVSQAMVISSASAAAADGAIVQLGQAFASGALRGDEFNSINEAAPRLMRALADSLGVGTGALRKMAEEGKLTSEVLSRALTGEQAAKIAAEFAKLPPTIEGALTVAGNAVTQFIGKVDQSSGASAALARGIQSAAGALSGLVEPTVAVVGVLTTLAGPVALGAVAVGFGRAAAASAVWAGSLVAQASASLAATAAAGGLAVAVRAVGAGMLTLVGGPIGAVVAALTLGAGAWTLWGDSAEQSGAKAEDALSRVEAKLEARRQGQLAARTDEQDFQSLLQQRQAIVERLSAAQTRLNELLAMPQGIGQRGDFAGSSAMARASGEIQNLRSELERLDASAAQLNTTTTAWVRASAQGFVDVMTAADPVAEAIRRVRDAIRDANAEPFDPKARDAFGALLDDLKKQEQALREQIASAEGGAVGLARFKAEQIGVSNATAEARAEFERVTGSIAALEGRLDGARAANRGNAEATREAAAAAREAKSAVDEYNGAMRQAAAQDVPALTRAALEQVAALDQLAGIRARLAATRQLTDDREAALLQQETRERERYNRAVEETLGMQRKAQAALDGLIPEIKAESDALGMSAGQRDRLRARIEAETEARRRLQEVIDAGGRSLGDAEADAYIRAAGAAAEAGVAQAELVAASQQAAAESARYWSGAASAISDAFGDFVASGLKSFSDFGRSIKRIAQQIISDLVAQFAQSRITVPIMLGAGFSPAAIAGATGLSPASVAGAAGGGGGMLGGLLGGIGASIGGFSAGLGVAGAAGFSAATSFGAASIAAGNFAVGLGALAGALGPVGLALGGINALTGGRLFGTSYRTDRTGAQFNFGESGASGFNFQEQSRRRSLFRGTARRTVESALDDDAQAQIDQFFASVGVAMTQAAAQLGVDVPPRIAASFRATTDASGNVISEVGTILGRQYNESFEVFSRRIAAENVIGVLDAALDGEAGRIAEAWRGSADTLADGAQFLLNAATDMRGGFRLLGDASLTGVAEFVQRLAGDGESLTAAYARISGATVLLTEAVGLMGVDLGRTREQFVEFAADIAEAAGGLEQAQGLWRGYFESFYTEQERGLVLLQQARQRGTAQAAGIGLDLNQFTGAGGMQAFRELFESRLPTLSADQVVAWLQFGSTLANITDLQTRYTDAVAQTAETIGEFMAGIDAALGEFAPEQTLEQQLAAQREANQRLIDRAVALGASEAELARVRELGQQRINAIIGSVSQQTETLRGSLRTLGIAAVGTAEEFAVAASGLSDDFGSLFEGFLGSFYSETERAVMRQTVAQGNLNAALQAAGLSTDNIISRTELRIQIEAALAAGNYKLAESLLRVARAMDQVDQAAGNAAQQVDAFGRPVGGNSTIGGGGGFDSSQGPQNGSNPFGTGTGGLVDDIEAIRQGLRDWLQSLTTGDLSPERPRDQLRRAQAEYQRLLAAAGAGDADALRQLQGASEQVLRLGRQVFGSSAGYTSLYNQIIAQVGGLVGFGGGSIGGPGGGNTRPVDDLGESAGRAAAALDALADRLGMPMGSLTVPSPQFGGVSDQQVSETAARPVVQELQRGQQQQRNDADRLRAELAAMREEMAELRRAAQDQARELAKANDIRRV